MNKDKKILKDKLTQTIGVLARRETEVRLLIPFLLDLYEVYGEKNILNILEKTIKDVARSQGEELSDEFGNDVDAFLKTLKFWTKDDALKIDILEKSEEKLSFNVIRCKYAEMYNALGVKDLGAVLSCNRDAALIEGFNKNASLDRKQTIMSGNKHCTFRYNFKNK